MWLDENPNKIWTKEEYESIKNSKVICNLPFQQLRNGTGINYQPCCWSRTMSPYGPQNKDPIEHFKGEDFTALRREMLLGKKTPRLKHSCDLCWKDEKETGWSPRLSNPLKLDCLQNFDKEGNMVETDHRFIKLELNAFGNYCNLQCYECQVDNSSGRLQAAKQLGKIDPKWLGLLQRYSFVDRDVKKVNPEQWRKFKNDIIKHAKNIRVIVFCGGEPMMMKSHFELLDELIEAGEAKGIELGYVSNMTHTTLDKMKKYLDAFRWTEFQWSVDGLTERNHWLRYPTKWDTTINNVFAMRDYLHHSNPNWKIGNFKCTITPSILGILQLHKTVQWMKDNDIFGDDNVLLNRIENPAFCQTRHLPDEVKEQIADNVKSVSDHIYQDMMQPRSEHLWKIALEYFDKTDQIRGDTNWKETFPELAKYALEYPLS